MAKFEVCLVELREYTFIVEADDADEAFERANEMEVDDSVRDQFRGRERDWEVKIDD